MTKNYLLFALLSSAVSGAHAASLNVDINNDTLRGQYNFSHRDADLGLSVAGMLTDDNGEVFSATARTQGALAGQRHIRGGFGGRAYHASPENGDSFQALAIGGYIDVTVPQLTELSFGVDVYYAPSITLTDDIDNLREITLRVSYQLFENAAVYGGLRHLEVEQDNFDLEFDDAAHVGFTLQF